MLGFSRQLAVCTPPVSASSAAPRVQLQAHVPTCSRDPLSTSCASTPCIQRSRPQCARSHQPRSRVLAQCSDSSADNEVLEGASPPLEKPRRVMLKVSGEALEGDAGFGIDPKVLRSVAAEVAVAVKEGIEVAIVVGGGNYFRGVDAWDGLDRATADHMGMLATCMNAICLQSALDAEGLSTRVQTAIDMRQVAEPYIRRRAIRHLERGRVVIFGAGTGNPFFTTDTAAALRAAEIDADVFLKATKVDGVYDCDPMKFPEAKLHRALTYNDVRAGNLAVMDETAITLCKENEIPVVVFNIMTPHNISRALMGDEDVGTFVNNNRRDEGSGGESLAAAAVLQGNGATTSSSQDSTDGLLEFSRQ